MKNRWIFLVILFLLSLSSCNQIVDNLEDNNEEKEIIVEEEKLNVDAKFYFTHNIDYIDMSSSYDSSLFLSDNQTYNKDLAKFAFTFALSSNVFYGNSDDYSINVINELYQSFDDCYLSDDFYQKEREDSLRYVFAYKKMKDYTLLLFTPNGSDYKNEWANNLDFGNSLIHQAIFNHANRLYEELLDYIKINELTNIRFLASGFSRGGMISQALGYLVDISDNSLLNKDNSYIYTFNTPNIFRLDLDISLFNNIYSIKNHNDLISHAFFSDTLGFRSIGNQIDLDLELYKEEVTESNSWLTFSNKFFEYQLKLVSLKPTLIVEEIDMNSFVNSYIKVLTFNLSSDEALDFYHENMSPIFRYFINLVFDNFDKLKGIKLNEVEIDTLNLISLVTNKNELFKFIKDILNKYSISYNQDELKEKINNLYNLILRYQEEGLLIDFVMGAYTILKNIDYVKYNHAAEGIYFYYFS